MSRTRSSMSGTTQANVVDPYRGVPCAATFKILLIGDACVGKTSLLNRYVEGQFQHNYVTTVGIDYKNKILEMDDTKVKLQIWDTAGQERFRTLTNAYYRGAHGVIIMYDITNRLSFNHVTEWIKSARQHSATDIQIVLVGHKSDKEEHRDIQTREGKGLAENHSARFFEASSLTGDNCEQIFYAIAEDIKNVRETNRNNESSGFAHLTDSTTSKQRNSCCSS